METLSSSFVQKYAPNHSITPSPPPVLLLLHFKISSVKIDEKYVKNSHQKAIRKNESSHKSNGRKNNPLLTNMFNALDNFISDFIDPPLRSSIDPEQVLSGNFAPVAELPPTACTVVQGSLPPSLSGTYIRNGPNPQFIPHGPYHMFEGDGMLHAVTISNGRATSCSRFVKTYKYNLERETGSPVILNAVSSFTGFFPNLARSAVALARFLAGEYDPRRGVGGANTSLALISGKLYALEECDLPYRVKLTSDGDIITLGRDESFGSGLTAMTAHPKIDNETGDAFAFRYGFRKPFLSYFRINAEGIKSPEIPILALDEMSFIHDFAITQNYAVFADTQIVVKPKEIVKGRSSLFTTDREKVPRLGIIGRYAEDDGDMWWVEVAGLNVIHAVNAWEEDGGDTIVMVATNVTPVEYALDRMDLIHVSLERIEIDVRTRSVRRRLPLCTKSLEFGVVNPAYFAKKSRYVYAAVGGPLPKIVGVVKLDLSLSTADCTVACHQYPPGCYGGEPFFVPKEGNNPAAEEDDGYLMTYVHDENTQESKFLIMDPKSPTLEIIAAVKLPGRVPYGFHGIFVPQSVTDSEIDS